MTMEGEDSFLRVPRVPKNYSSKIQGRNYSWTMGGYAPPPLTNNEIKSNNNKNVDL